jgi:uncharacterized protein
LYAGYPEYTDKYVNDFAHIINSVEITELRKLLESVEEQTGIEVSVVTINSINDFSETENNFERFATALFNKWGIGKKDTNNGILLLVSVKDRMVRIELGAGYSKEYDHQAVTIIQNDIVPYFKEGKFSEGVHAGAVSIIGMVTKKVSWLEFYKWHIVLYGLVLLFTAAGVSCLISGKKGWGWVFLAIVGFILLFLFKILDFLGGSKKSGGFGGGRSSGGGGSGGF